MQVQLPQSAPQDDPQTSGQVSLGKKTITSKPSSKPAPPTTGPANSGNIPATTTQTDSPPASQPQSDTSAQPPSKQPSYPRQSPPQMNQQPFPQRNPGTWDDWGMGGGGFGDFDDGFGGSGGGLGYPGQNPPGNQQKRLTPEERVKMIEKVYDEILCRKPDTRDINYYKYSTLDEEQIKKQLLASAEHKDMIKKGREYTSLKDRSEQLETRVRMLEGQIKDQIEEFRELSNLLQEKNRHITELRSKTVPIPIQNTASNINSRPIHDFPAPSAPPPVQDSNAITIEMPEKSLVPEPNSGIQMASAEDKPQPAPIEEATISTPTAQPSSHVSAGSAAPPPPPVFTSEMDTSIPPSPGGNRSTMGGQTTKDRAKETIKSIISGIF